MKANTISKEINNHELTISNSKYVITTLVTIGKPKLTFFIIL